jgi:hypothetical protein
MPYRSRRIAQTKGDPPFSGDHGNRQRNGLHSISCGFLRTQRGADEQYRRFPEKHAAATVILKDDFGNATIVPFSDTETAGTLTHVTGVSFNPLTKMPALRGTASFQQ